MDQIQNGENDATVMSDKETAFNFKTTIEHEPMEDVVLCLTDKTWQAGGYFDLNGEFRSQGKPKGGASEIKNGPPMFSPDGYQTNGQDNYQTGQLTNLIMPPNGALNAIFMSRMWRLRNAM